ncbi:MAG: single-stranded DNA-binding protein [Romboutsia timonensis]
MNKVIISGNLTRDMDVKVLANETLVGNFTVANQVGYGDKAKTNFVPVTMFGQRVESMEKYLVTGVKVLVEGEIDYKSVQDDKGNWKNYFSVIVHNIEIIKFKEDSPFEEDNKNKRNIRKGGRR